MIKHVNSRGFTLLEVMVGVAVVSIATMGIVGLSVVASNGSSEVAQKSSVLNLKEIVMSQVENPEAWKKTVQVGDSMSCIAAGTDCASLGTDARALDLYNSDGSIYYKSSDANYGFTADGKVCTAYSAGSTACPYHYNLNWKAVCPTSGICKNPLITVTGDLTSTSHISPMVQAQASFNMLRSFTKNSIERNCRAVNGTPDGNGNCTLPTQNIRCPAGQMVTGMTTSGSPTCAKPTQGLSCPVGQLVIGFDVTTGQPMCSSLALQMPINDPTHSGRISCYLLGKNEGDIWWAPNGQYLQPVRCPGGFPGYQNQAMNVTQEMICKNSYAVPTGRTNMAATDVYFGTCTRPDTLPTGVTAGDYYWMDEGTTTEAVACYGSPDPSLIRHITYKLEAEMYVSPTTTYATGNTRKTQISAESCPVVTKPQTLLFDLASTSLKPTTKFLIVVDNSASMSTFQSTLGTKLSALLQGLQGNNIQVKVINSTNPDKPNNADTWNYNGSFDIDTKTYLADGTTLFQDSMFNGTPMPVVTKTKFSLSALPTFKSSSYSDINKFQSDVKAEIIRQGTAGDNYSKGLCSTLLALEDQGPNSYFVKGDMGGIIILTDDKDYGIWASSPTATALKSCKGYINTNYTRNDNTAYTMQVLSYRSAFRYTALKDGVPVPNTPTWPYRAVKPSDPGTRTVGDNCPQAIIDEFAAGVKAVSADPTVNPTFLSCKLSSSGDGIWGIGYAADACNKPFSKDGQTWANIKDYIIRGQNLVPVDNNCVRNQVYYDRPGASDYGFIGDPLGITIYSKKTLSQAIYDRGQYLFGDKGFFLLNIVMTDPNSCSPVSTQQISQGNLDLATYLNSKSISATNLSICSAADAWGTQLTGLANNITAAIANSVLLTSLSPYTTINSVVVVHADSSQQILTSGTDYLIDGNRLDFTGYSIRAGDQLQVNATATYGP